MRRNKVVQAATVDPTLADKIVSAVAKLQTCYKASTHPTLHVVYSGLNERIRANGADPIATIAAIVATGKLYTRACKGGALVSTLPFPVQVRDSAQSAVGKLGIL